MYHNSSGFLFEGFVFLGFRGCALVLRYLWKVVPGFVSMGKPFPRNLFSK